MGVDSLNKQLDKKEKSNLSSLSKTRKELVDMYIKCLEDDSIPWEKMWKTSIPENGVTNLKYRGVIKRTVPK